MRMGGRWGRFGIAAESFLLEAISIPTMVFSDCSLARVRRVVAPESDAELSVAWCNAEAAAE